MTSSPSRPSSSARGCTCWDLVGACSSGRASRPRCARRVAPVSRGHEGGLQAAIVGRLTRQRSRTSPPKHQGFRAPQGRSMLMAKQGPYCFMSSLLNLFLKDDSDGSHDELEMAAVLIAEMEEMESNKRPKHGGSVQGHEGEHASYTAEAHRRVLAHASRCSTRNTAHAPAVVSYRDRALVPNL
ncbi:hypothetical protein C2845_PM17G13740 [Panicum miliaceum]|uniref:Uncharacterized protein n=1 Tax=Panicum miliaceum TaxID=4540 RepID=A0A3L6Q3D9_PANMI|nr:hypothetical protein C2845_PM17G13740 [Panicum miliaceum]